MVETERKIDRSILVEFADSMGEFYFVAPLLYNLTSSNSCSECLHVDLMITSSELYTELMMDQLFLALKERLRPSIFKIGVKKSPKLWAFLTRVVLKLAIRFRLQKYDLILLPITKSKIAKYISVINSSAFMYPHTSGPMFYPIETGNSFWREGKRKYLVRLINNSSDENMYYELRHKVKTCVSVGYHASTDTWQDFVRSIATNLPHEYIAVFSYQVRQSNMPKADFVKLHKTTFESIRKVFGDIPILVKPHPRQDARDLENFINLWGFENILVTKENPVLLAAHAKCSVSFLTSGIFNAVYLNRPAVNYYLSKAHYIQQNGVFKHDYASIGIADVDNQDQLLEYLESIVDSVTDNTFYLETRRVKLLLSVSEIVENARTLEV